MMTSGCDTPCRTTSEIACDGCPRGRLEGEGTITTDHSSVPAELSMVVLSTRDVPSLRSFYRALGWSEQAGSTDELCRFQLGAVVLTLYSDPHVTDGTGSAGPSHTTLVIPFASAELLDAAYRTASDAGAELLVPPTDQPWGGRSSVMADPEGHRWEFLWVPVR
jgi:predicted enzyme related to lactoylglutathione lyase